MTAKETDYLMQDAGYCNGDYLIKLRSSHFFIRKKNLNIMNDQELQIKNFSQTWPKPSKNNPIIIIGTGG